jgi:dGTPase
LEAEIMDWSDDVAYAVHDMEDFFRAGLIPLDRLASDRHERERFLESESLRQRDKVDATALKDAFDFVMKISPTLEPYRGRSKDRGLLRNFTSSLIDRYVSAVSLDPMANTDRSLVIDDAIRAEVAALKGLTWHYVIDSRSLTAQRFGQRSLVRSLFNILCNAAKSENDWHVFPEFYQEALADAASENEKVVRVVADLISSMAESQLIAMHQRLTGSSLGSAMDPIVP